MTLVKSPLNPPVTWIAPAPSPNLVRRYSWLVPITLAASLLNIELQTATQTLCKILEKGDAHENT